MNTYFSLYLHNKNDNETTRINQIPSISDLNNEIYMFTTPNETIKLNSIYLEKFLKYNVCLEILTPCS